MPRRRRIAIVALLALVGSLGLVGCGRAQPGTAAYVGGTRYTDEVVDELADNARGVQELAQLDRRDFLGWLVVGDLARRVAAGKSIAVPPADYDAAAQQLKVDPSRRLVRVYGDYVAALSALARGIPATTPTEQDLREIFDGAKAGRVVPADVTFEQVAAQIAQLEELPVRVAVYKVVKDAADKANVVVGPKYRPLVGGVIQLPLNLSGNNTSPVTDLPRG